MVVMVEENMHVNVWFDHLQMTPGGHTENVWEPGNGGKGRTPPNPGGMIPNARRTIISKTRSSIIIDKTKWQCHNHVLVVSPKLDEGLFFLKTFSVGGSSFLPVFLVCAGRGNASAGSPQAHLHYWLFLVAVLAHGGHSGDGPVEVSQVLLLFIFIYLILTSVMEVCLPRGSSLVRKVSVSLASLAIVNGCSVTT